MRSRANNPGFTLAIMTLALGLPGSMMVSRTPREFTIATFACLAPRAARLDPLRAPRT